MSNLFTAGPWTMEKEGDPDFPIWGEQFCVATVWAQGQEGEANARLIAAAPDLLAACEWALRVILYNLDRKEDCMSVLKAAIDKTL